MADLSEVSDDELLAELERRGYVVVDDGEPDELDGLNREQRRFAAAMDRKRRRRAR